MPRGSQRRANELLRLERPPEWMNPKCGWPLLTKPGKRCGQKASWVTPVAEIAVCGHHRQPGSDLILDRRHGL